MIHPKALFCARDRTGVITWYSMIITMYRIVVYIVCFRNGSMGICSMTASMRVGLAAPEVQDPSEATNYPYTVSHEEAAPSSIFQGREPPEATGSQGKPLEATGSHGKPLEATGNQGKPQEATGIIQTTADDGNVRAIDDMQMLSPSGLPPLVLVGSEPRRTCSSATKGSGQEVSVTDAFRKLHAHYQKMIGSGQVASFPPLTQLA
jgi:hypothetical protein